MGRFIKISSLLWRYSPLVTLPISIFFLVWLGGTYKMYSDIVLRYLPLPFEHQDLDFVGRLKGETMVRGITSSLNIADFGGGAHLPRVHLFVDEGGLRSLDGDIPYSGKRFVGGRLIYPDGELKSVKVRYRGDFAYHWSGDKRSIRVKTKKGSLYKGMREFNLIVPKSVFIRSNFLAYRLGRYMGILSPETEMVELYINGRYNGVMVLVEKLNEQFLRRNSRLPGDLYSGELVGDDAYFGFSGPGDLFTSAEFWRKGAVNNHFPAESKDALHLLTELVYEDRVEELSEILDLERWADFSAYLTLTQSTHYDKMHNWRLYYNPGTGLFEPLIWDTLGWFGHSNLEYSEDELIMDMLTSRLLAVIEKDHRFLAMKHESVQGFFEGGGVDYIREELQEREALDRSLKGDRNLSFMHSTILKYDEVVGYMDHFENKVLSAMELIKRAFVDGPVAARYMKVEGAGGTALQLNVESFKPLKNPLLTFKEGDIPVGTLNEGGGGGGKVLVRVRYLYEGKYLEKTVAGDIKRVEVKKGGLSAGTGVFSVRLPVTLMPAREVLHRSITGGQWWKAKVKGATYIIDIEGVDMALLTSLEADLGGPSGVEERVEEFRGGPGEVMALHPLDGNYNVAPVLEAGGIPIREVLWRGTKVVAPGEVLRIDENLTVEGGTRVILGEGASIIVKGRLTVNGTEREPVTFTSREGGGPWGAIILKGSGADGSTVRHGEFRGGSGAFIDLVEYSGMFSFHGVKGLILENTTFGENYRVDDMVHGVYSEVKMKGVTISGAKFDGLDLDYVDGTIEGSDFLENGNDGLDLMSSTIIVTSSRMVGSGDKGISVGEGSELLLWNSALTDNAIGVQVKDSSVAAIYNSAIEGNSKGVDAYSKNWQYGGGGKVSIFKSRIVEDEDGGELLSAAKGSTIEVFDSYLRGEYKSKRTLVDELSGRGDGYERVAKSGGDLFGGVSGGGGDRTEWLRPLLEKEGIKVDTAVRGTVPEGGN